MSMTKRWWLAAPLVAGLVLVGCNGDDGGADATDAPATDAPVETEVTTAPADPEPEEAPEEPAGDGGETASIGVVMLGEEEIAISRALCFFEEQPRAGLGGVFTHTAQFQGTDAEGQPVVLDTSQARAEDDTIDVDISVTIGDPFSEEAVSLSASGPEGLVVFGESSVSADGVEITDFESDPVPVTFDLPCN